MRIGFIAQTEVTDILRLILSLTQRAQHHGLQQGRIRPTLDTFEQLGVIDCLRLVVTTQLQTKLLEELTQPFQFFGGRSLMDTVQDSVFVFVQIIGRTHVSCQHAFLDQLVSVVTYHRNDALDLALVVKDHLRLYRFEIDRTALVSRM